MFWYLHLGPSVGSACGPHDTEYINVKYVKTYCGLKSRFQKADEEDSFILLCTPGKDKNIKTNSTVKHKKHSFQP